MRCNNCNSPMEYNKLEERYDCKTCGNAIELKKPDDKKRSYYG